MSYTVGELETVLDELQSKLGEKKAWASSQEARTTQGRFVAMTENLLLLYEHRLEREHGIHNVAVSGDGKSGWAGQSERVVRAEAPYHSCC